MAFPCKASCRWSELNISRGPETRRRILRERLENRDDLNLLFDAIILQCTAGRHVSAENPAGSVAWKDPRFAKLKCRCYYAACHECALGLRHPTSGLPVWKSTTIFTTRSRLAQHIGQYRCSGKHCHDHLSGTYMGRSVSSWAENYALKMARALVVGRYLPPSPSFGEADGEEVTYESLPRFPRQFGRANVLPAYFENGVVRDSAYPAAPDEPTIFEVTDPDLNTQLNALQSSGRYRRDDLPVPVQAQLRAWTRTAWVQSEVRDRTAVRRQQPWL